MYGYEIFIQAMFQALRGVASKIQNKKNAKKFKKKKIFFKCQNYVSRVVFSLYSVNFD